jgi:predicted nucleic acid-binding protein
VKKVDAFWDASAIVPLCVGQAGSGFAREALRSKSIAVWWGTPVEAASAFARLARGVELDQRSFRMAMTRLTALRGMWIEVQPGEGLRDLVEGLIERHPLRAADALQLAAAVIWSRRRPRDHAFVCLDGRLAEAAGKEGFSVEAM